MRAAVVTVFIATTKSFTEVVLVLCHVDIVTVVPVARIVKGVATLRIKLPSVLLVGLTGAETLFVTIVDRASQQVSSILIDIVRLAVSVVAVIRIAIVVIVKALQSYLILPQPLPIALLKAILVEASLLLQLLLTLNPPALLFGLT